MSRGMTHKSRRKTPWDGKEEKNAVQKFLYEQHKSQYDSRHPELGETGETALINAYSPEECPHCGSGKFKKNGRTGNGVQRYKCSSCGQTFTPVTKTIFEGHKVSLSEWVEYAMNIFRYVSINADSWNNRNSFTTSRYWLEKLFLVLESYQGELRLGGKVWLDETFYSVRSGDVALKDDGNKPRGLSANQMCIGVACDESHTLCIFEGYGKPSQKKTHESFMEHIAVGSTLIHDGENAHKKLVRELRLKSVAYDSNEIKRLSDRDNPLNRVNRIHFLLKNFLHAHASFDRAKIQGYLNLFAFVMNPPSDHLEKVELLLNLAFQFPKSLRYRDFFALSPIP
ncbi:MAG: transposase [Oscillospiraceae bacterium]|nr:transposase [Oscillospiraceae bacterium]